MRDIFEWGESPTASEVWDRVEKFGKHSVAPFLRIHDGRVDVHDLKAMGGEVVVRVRARVGIDDWCPVTEYPGKWAAVRLPGE